MSRNDGRIGGQEAGAEMVMEAQEREGGKKQEGLEVLAGQKGQAEKGKPAVPSGISENEESPAQEKVPKGSRRQEALQESILEAVLFTMGDSVELRRLAAAIDEDEETARQAAERLQKRYDREKRGIQIIELDGCYQMCTRMEYYENLIRVAATPKKHVLTEVVLETLSIIAYKQPVTKLEIEKIRGVKSDHAVNRLVEYNLVQEVGRLDAPGRPALFATTEEFLRRFGIGSREELPDMDPVQAAEIRSQVEEELKLHREEDGLQDEWDKEDDSP